MRRVRIAAVAASLVFSTTVPAAWAGTGETRAVPVVSTVQGPSVTLAPNEALELPRLFCPEGQTSTGGGLTLSPDNGVFVNASNPAGPGWEVSVHNLSDGPRTVTPLVAGALDPSMTHRVGNIVSGDTAVSSAFCPSGQSVAGGGGAAATQRTGEGVAVPAGQVTSAHVECPAGQVPSAGGGLGDPHLLHDASAPTATGGTIRATNTDNVQRFLHAEVLCTTP